LWKTRQGKNGDAPVYCRVTVNGERAEFSINRKFEMNISLSRDIHCNLYHDGSNGNFLLNLLLLNQE
jgi:hypothetical protein